MKILILSVAVLSVFLFSGCVSYSYSGEKGEAGSGNVSVFTDSAKIKRPYQVLGRATVSGNYQHVSRDRMMEKLNTEARKAGADAVLIVEQQVLPAGMFSHGRGQGFFSVFDYDDSNRSWGELHRDVDVNFGSIGKDKNVQTSSGSGYKRVIRAEFLRFSDVKEVPKKK